MKLVGYSVVGSSNKMASEIRQNNFKVIYASAEKVMEKTIREILGSCYIVIIKVF